MSIMSTSSNLSLSFCSSLSKNKAASSNVNVYPNQQAAASQMRDTSSSRSSIGSTDISVMTGTTNCHSKSTGYLKPSSVYVPQARFSRYLDALSSLSLLKFNRLPGSQLPLDKVGLLTNTSLSWLNEYLSAGYIDGMREKILPTLSQPETCDVNGPRLESILQAHFVEKGQAGASIPLVAWQFVSTRVLISTFIHFIGILLSLIGPMFILGEIINETAIRHNLTNQSSIIDANLTGQDNDLSNNLKLFGHTALLIFVELISQFLVAWSSSLNLRTACRLRSACLAVCYKKLLRSSLRCSINAQQTLTYFVPDSETLHELVGVGPLVLGGPAALVAVAIFTCYTLDYWLWALSGVFMVVFLYTMLVIAAYFTKSFAARAIEFSLRRMALVEEFISNIALAKITLWDQHFQDRIKDIRKRELSEMQFGGFSEGCGLSMVHLIPVFAVATTTLVGILYDQQISFVKFVPVLVLFLINLKHCIRTSWMALSSISRGVAFLNKLKTILILQEHERFLDKPIDKNVAIMIHNGHFTWSKDKYQGAQNGKRSSRFYVNNHENNAVEFNFTSPLVTTLSEIDFYVPKGKLVGVYGHQDSGKTSLLLTILGQLRRCGGTIAIDGSCSYAARESWLLDGTVKENVVFGESFDSNKYYRSIRAANLSTEIAALPEQEDTDVTCTDVSPILCQKVALARVVYAQKDINLLDEPLADLNNLERLEIFDKCVVQMLGQKTVILASDKVALLSRCHIIYVMHDGKIIECGAHDELVRSNSQYAKLTSHQLRSINYKRVKNGELASSTPSRATPTSPTSCNTSCDSIDDNIKDTRPLYRRHLDFPALQSINEMRQEFGPTLYLSYSGGWTVCILLFSLASLYAFSISITPFWILLIAQKESKEELRESVGWLATLLGFLTGCGIILMIAYNKTIFMTATKLHDYWIENLSTAQISAFSSSTISLLLNICSLNLQEVDSVLPRSIITVLINISISLISTIILSMLSPWFLFPVLVYIFIAATLSIYVRGAVLSLQELKINSATVVLNYISNTVQGRAIIQAFSKEKDCTKKYYKLFNENSTYDFMLYATKLWLEFRLKLSSVLVLSAVIFISEVLQHVNSMHITYSKLAGLCLSYVCTMQLTLSVLHTIGAINNIYTSLMAIHSVDHYMKTIPKEKEGSARVGSNWPIEGTIEFKNVLLFDRENSTNKPLRFNIAGGQNIAVISSQAETRAAFIGSFFRFYDFPSGEIIIDRASVSHVPLATLRRCICFIPGNPNLFNGTIRYNLDPGEKQSDQVLMLALQRVYLWEKISKLPSKLVSDSRHLFNVYEKILLFLARALLNEHVKIIIIEEPVMDVTDRRGEVLELVLQNVFVEYTIIRIASHRVRGCQKYLPLDDEIEDYNSERASSSMSHFN